MFHCDTNKIVFGLVLAGDWMGTSDEQNFQVLPWIFKLIEVWALIGTFLHSMLRVVILLEVMSPPRSQITCMLDQGFFLESLNFVFAHLALNPDHLTGHFPE